MHYSLHLGINAGSDSCRAPAARIGAMVIPFAVRWYTGEAAPDSDSDEDDDEDDDDEDDEDEESSEDCASK